MATTAPARCGLHNSTAAALRELESHKVKAAFITAMEAARDRSRALAKS